MVFQSYALWPHMTVRKNIGYPLKARKLKGPDGQASGSRTPPPSSTARSSSTGIPPSSAAASSSGSRWHVASSPGRTWCCSTNRCRNLDARLRDQVRAQLHELHARLRFTAVFVTHDQSEALASADRVAIMRAGRFEQVGTPEHVFEEPATEYVAGFIGMSNRLPLIRDGSGWTHEGEPVDRRSARSRRSDVGRRAPARR